MTEATPASERSPLLKTTNNGHSNGHRTFPDDGAAPPGPAQNSDTEAAEAGNEREVSAKMLASIVVPMSIGIFLAAMDQTVVVASYAAIGNELEQLNKTSWIATSYMLTLTSFQPLYGKLSDIFGRKICLLTAYSIFAIGCLLCGLSTSMDQLIVSRAISGVGGGGMSTVVSIIMSDIVPLRSRGTWQGVINIVFATGSSVGAPLGGFFADSIGWRWAFLVQVPAALIAIVSVSLALRLPTNTALATPGGLKSKVKRVDFTGALSLVLTIFFLLSGLERGGNIGWNNTLTVIFLALFGAWFVLFLTTELKLAVEPFAPKRIIANPSLLFAYLVNFFGLASSMTMLFHVSLYLQAVLDFSPSQSGWYLVPSIIAGVTGSLAGGLIIQATGRYYWITVSAYLTQFTGVLILCLVTGVTTTSSGGIIAGLFVMGLGNGVGVTTSLIALISNAGKEDQAMATAVSYLFRSLGSVVGLSVGATVLQDVLRNRLRERLGEGTIGGLDIDEVVNLVRSSLEFLSTLDPATRQTVRESYADAIHATFWVCLGTIGCAVLASGFIKESVIGRK